MSFIARRFLSNNLVRSNLLSSRRLCLSSMNMTTSSVDQPKTSAGVVSVDFLKEIVDKNAKNGRRFVLPVADTEALEQIMQPLAELIASKGVPADTLRELLTSYPQLFVCLARKGKQCLSFFDTLADFCSFNYENSLRFLAENLDEIDVLNHENIRDCLNMLAGQGFVPGPQIGRIVRKCPALVSTTNGQRIDVTYEKLANFFPKKNLKQLVLEAPHILLMPFNDVSLKYEYIYFHMGIEPTKLSLAYNWIDLNLDEIIMRHNFLKKTGKYITPNPKKPQFEMQNPSPHRIFDTSEKAFANEVAGVTEEEWNVFCQIHAKLKALEDKDEPYERIKPSLKKQYERRIKKAESAEDFYFEVA